MSLRRVPVIDTTSPEHGDVYLESDDPNERLPANKAYVDTRSGIVKDARQGHRLRDLMGGEIEIPVTQWYGNVNRRRLDFDVAEMSRLLPTVRLDICPDCPKDGWRRYAWKGRLRDGRDFEARYPDNYPYAQLDISVAPDISTHHKIGKNYLCLMRPEEWSPDFTAATNILIAVRFLFEHQQGRTER